jgi:hypothetical protein
MISSADSRGVPPGGERRISTANRIPGGASTAGSGEADDVVSGRSHDRQRATLTSATGQLFGRLRAVSRGRCQPDPDIDGWLRTPGRGGHSLVALRDRLLDLLNRPELNSGHLPLSEESLEGRLLVELHALDPRGDELRYPSRWDAIAKANVATRMPGGADTVGRSVLIDVERMGADPSNLNPHLGGIHDSLYEQRYRPMTESS